MWLSFNQIYVWTRIKYSTFTCHAHATSSKITKGTKMLRNIWRLSKNKQKATPMKNGSSNSYYFLSFKKQQSLLVVRSGFYLVAVTSGWPTWLSPLSDSRTWWCWWRSAGNKAKRDLKTFDFLFLKILKCENFIFSWLWPTQLNAINNYH